MSRVLMLTTEPLPLEGWPTTGAGLRAWGLAQGLRARGHQVTLLMADDAARGFAPPEGSRSPTREFPDWIGTFARSGADGSSTGAASSPHAGLKTGDPRLRECDVIVLQHWGVARHLGEVDVPLAIDLAGPHLLERRLWGSGSAEADLSEKLDALRRADFVTVSGERQRFYALPFLAMAGWDVGWTRAPQKSMQPGVSSPGIAVSSSPGGGPSAFSIPVIPFSLRPDPAPAPPRGTRFIYGGFFLPWQDISATLNVVMEELEAADKGELIFVGGAHPHLDVSGGSFEELADRLSHHPRVKFHGPMSYGDYMGLLREGGIALDLMARNPERELAFTTRTVQFMACGLPVIHDNYSELGEMIERRGAGWTLDPEDREGLRALVRGLLDGEIDPAERGAAALGFVEEELDWERTIEPLHRFCASPRERSGKTAARLSFEERDARQRRIETELSQTQARLNALRGKRWVRWGMRAFSTRGLMAWPMALLALIVGFLLIPIFWLSDRLPKKA